MVELWPLWPPRSVAKALGTRATLAELAVILAAHSQTVRKDGMERMPEERSGRVIHSFLAQL